MPPRARCGQCGAAAVLWHLPLADEAPATAHFASSPELAVRLVRRPGARDALGAAKARHAALGARLELVLRAAAQAARSRHLARARATAAERLGLGQLALRLEQQRRLFMRLLLRPCFFGF